MKVLLISDPNLNKSAAAMDVGVGSFSDPIEHQGIAHFLEHMLFMGTEKYPEVDEYNQFLNKHQGYSNAYTSSEHTNYFFEVNHDAFDGALDRFAQFFIAPTFDAHFVKRERLAVNSEHEKNLENDGWKVRQLFRNLHKEGHPIQKFSTGDSTTLAQTDRATLIKFYEEHYSADIMRLTLLSPLPTEKLSKLAHTLFAEVANRQHTRENFDSVIFEQKELPRLIQVKPIKDLHNIEFVFAVPSQHKNWESKPSHTVSHLLGHEGEGSLLSLLKKEGLANKLSAGERSYTFAGTFHVDIELSEKGVKEWKRVAEAFFAYVKILRSEELRPYIFDELKTMADLDYFYKEHREGGDLASYFASRMQIHPGEDIEKRDDLLFKLDNKQYNEFLSYITVANLNVILTDKNVETDKLEPIYKTAYSVHKLSNELQQRLNKIQVSDALTLPNENLYIPSKLNTHFNEKGEAAKLLINNENMQFWFQKDSSFHLPKGGLRIDILTPIVNGSAKERILSFLYQEALSETLNEWKYMVTLGGLDFSFQRNSRGFALYIDGYSEKIPLLLSELSQKLTHIAISKERFELIKNDYKRKLDNLKHLSAYQQSLYELSFLSEKNKIHYKSYYDPKKQVDLVSPITLEDLHSFTKSVFTTVAFEGAAYGSLDEKEIRNGVSNLAKTLGGKALAKDLYPEDTMIAVPQGKDFYILRNNPTNNHSWVQSAQFGAHSYRLNAILRIGLAHLSPNFFTSLRSKQQLGYVVTAHMLFHQKVLGMRFLIQSSDHTPTVIANKVNTWKQEALKEMAKIPAEEFEVYRNAVITELSEEDKTMADKLNTLFFEAITMKEAFGYKQKVIQEAQTITQQETVEAFTNALNKDAATLAVYLYSDEIKQQQPASGKEILDVAIFKKSASTY